MYVCMYVCSIFWQECKLQCCKACWLSGPLRLRVQSWSRTRLRIVASDRFLFALVLKGF